jgi:guanine deaminase
MFYCNTRHQRINADRRTDTHIHASQYPNAGIFGKSTLLDWLNTYTFPLEASLSDLKKARTVYTRCVSRTLSHGTTTASYYATRDKDSTNVLADICLHAGQRAFIGRCCMDNMSPDYYKDDSPESAIADTKACIAHINKLDPNYELVSPILTPRFAPSCTSPLLHSLGALAKETQLPIQTHIAENVNEVQLVRQLFPESTSYAQVYDTHGLLTEKMILAHAIHLSAAEVELIKSRDAKISHCPASNSALTSGGAKVRWLLDSGITVGLGTDMSGGYSPSMLEAVRQAALVSRHVSMLDGEAAKLSIEEVLHLGTRGGAKVVGLQDVIGGFEVGKEFDVQLVGLSLVPEHDGTEGPEGISGALALKKAGDDEGPVDIFGWESWDERVAKWVYNGDDRNTLAVWVKGKMVHTRN